MIIDLIFYTGSFILILLGGLFSALSFIFPEQITTAINYFVSFFNYFRGWLPIDQMLIAGGVYSTFLGFWYAYKVIRYVYAHIPWVGSHHPHPKHHDQKK